jgi:uncharacterized membrane protein YfcA
VIGLIGSFCSGLLGVGGAIVTYPLLYFVPPLFEVYALTPNQIASVTMFQVFAATGIGMVLYQRSPWMSWTVVGWIGGGMVLGSLTGSLMSGSLPGLVIHALYGCMALLAVVLLLQKQRGEHGCEQPGEVVLHKPLAVTMAMSVGLLSGIAGAGGSFLLIPLMIRVLKVPIRTAIASSLTIVFVSSIGGVIGKSVAGDVLPGVTFCLVVASLLGSMLGVKLGQRLHAHVLRLVLALVVALAGGNILMEILRKYL